MIGDISINAVDVLLGFVTALGIWGGWIRGFIRGALELLLLALGLLAALWGYHPVAALTEQHVASLGAWTRPLAFLSIFIVARLTLGGLLHPFLSRLPVQTHGHRANRALGTIPGFINGLINATIVAVLLLSVPLFDGLSAKTRDSTLANHLAAPAEWLEAKLSPVFDQAVRQTLNRLTVQPESRESVKLPFAVSSPKAREDLEARMLELVNEECKNEGLPPLKPDPELAIVARAHSTDMFARRYFSHVTPDGKGPFDRMRQARVRFVTAGENLALAPTLAAAHRGLMNSPGHRANILKPSFSRLGIGILDGGRYGLMVTQNFRN